MVELAVWLVLVTGAGLKLVHAGVDLTLDAVLNQVQSFGGVLDVVVVVFPEQLSLP